jgi:transposase
VGQVPSARRNRVSELTVLVRATGGGLRPLNGIGPSGAARLIGDIGRFASRGIFASWNGTAPIDASSGDQQRHQLSRAGSRRINRVLHIMAVVQLRHDTQGRSYYRRRLAEGKTPMEAMRREQTRLASPSAPRRWSFHLRPDPQR